VILVEFVFASSPAISPTRPPGPSFGSSLDSWKSLRRSCTEGPCVASCWGSLVGLDRANTIEAAMLEGDCVIDFGVAGRLGFLLCGGGERGSAALVTFVCGCFWARCFVGCAGSFPPPKLITAARRAAESVVIVVCAGICLADLDA
jgi:hypothetical protein